MNGDLFQTAAAVGAAAFVFTCVVAGLVGLVLGARALLVPRGTASVAVNGRPFAVAPLGTNLLAALADAGIALPAACGGRGTCGLCRVRVVSGGGDALPVDRERIPRADLAAGVRLACQTAVRGDIAVELPEDLLGAHERTCVVRSARSVTTFLREVILDLPPGEAFEFRAGAFVQVHAPPHRLRFREFDVAPEFRDEWDRLDLWRLESFSAQHVVRAYSLANHPGEGRVAHLVVRIATPPPASPPGVPPGVVSSYLFGLRPGDRVTISGPFGNFHAEESGREMVFVGGGAGMAPMRAHVLDQIVRLRTLRRITFWYGARSRREIPYAALFDRLAAEHANFSWQVALSEPRLEDAWTGHVGYVHLLLEDRHLRVHAAPEDCEYYLCGPPLMIRATTALLEEYGVPPEHVHFDDFGGG